jgi:hypothetical protein
MPDPNPASALSAVIVVVIIFITSFIIVLLTIHSIIRLVLLDMLQYQVIIMPGGDLSPPGMQR